MSIRRHATTSGPDRHMAPVAQVALVSAELAVAQPKLSITDGPNTGPRNTSHRLRTAINHASEAANCIEIPAIGLDTVNRIERPLTPPSANGGTTVRPAATRAVDRVRCRRRSQDRGRNILRTTW